MSRNKYREVSQRQAQSMAVLAYDAKRDGEVMKAITVVRSIFLHPLSSLYVRPCT